MAVLEKIRVKLGVVISVIIALALLSFIIDPGTLESALNSMSSKYDVGQIAGKRISYTDFQSDVDRYTTISELLGANRSEDTQKQARNAAWQELLDKYMFVKNAKEDVSAKAIEKRANRLKGVILHAVLCPFELDTDVFANFKDILENVVLHVCPHACAIREMRIGHLCCQRHQS